MLRLGIPYGENLINRVRAAAQAAMKAGLRSNQYTNQSLPGLEHAWVQLKTDIAQRQHQLEAPAPALPAVPFGGTFQPFKISRRKELMLLLDTTASMNAPISEHNETARLETVREALRLLLDQLSFQDKGLPTVTFAGGEARDIGELSPDSLQTKWDNIDFVGNTRIMPGWRMLQRRFQDTYGRVAEAQRPVMVCVLICDGDALDGQEFERAFANEPEAYIIYALVGYGEEHDQALAAFSRIAAKNDRLIVLPLHGGGDAEVLAGTIFSCL